MGNKGKKIYPDTHICLMCGLDKKRANFEKIKGAHLGISPICRNCDTKTYGVKHIQFHYEVTTEDYIGTFELLRMIGYDTDGDIHKQFCDKYGLEYTKRKPDFYDKKTINK